jgi:hypothetical protein
VEHKLKYICLLVQYIVERHGKTLLPQYLGMYRLTVDGVEHYLVAMRNVFSNHLQTHRYIIVVFNFVLLFIRS